MWDERVRGKKELRQRAGDEYEMGVQALQEEEYFLLLLLRRRLTCCFFLTLTLGIETFN